MFVQAPPTRFVSAAPTTPAAAADEAGWSERMTDAAELSRASTEICRSGEVIFPRSQSSPVNGDGPARTNGPRPDFPGRRGRARKARRRR